MRISYSSLETFQTCPLKFKYQEIEKVKAPKSKEAIVGTAVHNALRFYHGTGPLFPGLNETKEFYRAAWNSAAVSWKNADEELAYFKDGEAMLITYCSLHSPRDATILDLEVKFSASIEDASPSETHSLTGKIDRIDKNEDGTIEIIDYKTAKRMPAQARIDESLQLAIYHIGLKQRWPELRPKKVKLSLYFLRHGEKLSTFGSDEKIGETKNRIVSLIHEINKSDFPPTPGPLCDWCGYRSICPMWAHKYKKSTAAPKENELQAIISEFFSIKDQERNNAKKIKDLRKCIESYYDSEGLERVFGQEGHISRVLQKRFRYDLNTVKEILEPLGLWESVISLDAQKLKKILTSLPSSLAQRVNAARALEREFKIITLSKKTKGFQNVKKT